MLALKCPAQNYDWGRQAADSEVAQVAQRNGTDIDASKPYAELWMGTHPSGPAVVVATGETLKTWIEAHPSCLGSKVLQKFGAELPFLFKILSVRTALSIQSHPDKALAEKLHATHPQHYKDDNHKPEMALAISDFEALCGFLSPAELLEAVQVPELADCIGGGPLHALHASDGTDKQALRDAFTAVMTSQPGRVTATIRQLVSRLKSLDRPLTPREQLTLRLNQQYPDDVGVLSSYFLNYVSLPAGSAIYLAANEPHAYLSGQLMEVMATSDNVIRAGLTPKFKHVDVLCSSLTYSQGPPEVLTGSPLGENVRVFRPPFQEFEIHGIDVTEGKTATLPENPGPQLLLVQHGTGRAAAHCDISGDGLQTDADLSRGCIYFVPATTQITVTASSDLHIWAAACNANFFTLFDVPSENGISTGEEATEKVLVAA